MKKIAELFKTTFSPLKNKNLSMYLGGSAVSLIGTAMQATAQSWVVWQLSHSTKALGLVSMLSFAPLLVLGGLGGVWAERLDRRKTLLWIQAVAAALAFGFAVLVHTNLIRLWHIYLLAAILGSITALDMPAQMAYMSDLTGINQIRKAAVLNNMIRQASRTLGPALAGMAIGSLGVPSAFWINGTSFLAVIGSLLVIKSKQPEVVKHTKDSGRLKEAWLLVVKQPRMQDLLLISACVPFFTFSIGGLLPAIATEILHKGPQALGIIEGAAGAGALVGSMFLVPVVQRFRHAGRAITTALVWSGVCYAAAAYSSHTWIWTICLFLGSAIVPVVMTTSTGLLQMIAPAEMKARIMGIWTMLSFGTQPFGALLIGYIAHVIGARAAILVYSSALVLIGSALLLRRGLREWQPDVHTNQVTVSN